jgi:chemotaxis protein MotB
MMAFFLLMWLLGSTTKGDLQGIADYFQHAAEGGAVGRLGQRRQSQRDQGGGQDLTRTSGQVKRGEIEAERKRINLQALKAEAAACANAPARSCSRKRSRTRWPPTPSWPT